MAQPSICLLVKSTMVKTIHIFQFSMMELVNYKFKPHLQKGTDCHWLWFNSWTYHPRFGFSGGPAGMLALHIARPVSATLLVRNVTMFMCLCIVRSWLYLSICDSFASHLQLWYCLMIHELLSWRRQVKCLTRYYCILLISLARY